MLTLGTADARKAAAEHARIAHSVEQHLLGLLAGVRTLSRRQAVALAGVIYAGFTEAGLDAPETAASWKNILVLNEQARRGRYGRAVESMAGPERLAASMEERFGVIADILLGNQALIVDAPSRELLLRELGHALDDAASKMARSAEGDYRPDPAAGRFPEWKSERPRPDAPKAMSLPNLFARGAEHPEQLGTARRTKSRYRGVFAAVDEFLGGPDAQAVTSDDLQRYFEARMPVLRRARSRWPAVLRPGGAPRRDGDHAAGRTRRRRPGGLGQGQRPW